jgi:hypothetical protein
MMVVMLARARPVIAVAAVAALAIAIACSSTSNTTPQGECTPWDRPCTCEAGAVYHCPCFDVPCDDGRWLWNCEGPCDATSYYPPDDGAAVWDADVADACADCATDGERESEAASDAEAG